MTSLALISDLALPCDSKTFIYLLRAYESDPCKR